ncbi:MAG TPA: DUF1801 domain-containing protein [Bacteroidota bacterium]|nr:DUF1801 domain-containing protein [Bacteroidota bacterium]
MKTKTFKSTDEYISSFPPPVRKKLTELRRAIREAAPDATERISYRMPAFFLNGVLVWFAAHGRHIGFYPTGSGIEAFEDQLSDYVFSKGAVQFPLDEPLPLSLVKRMVRFRVKQNMLKARK